MVVHDYPPLTGGGLALAALELAKLARPHAQVTLLTSRLRDHFADDRAQCARPRASGSRDIDIRRVRIFSALQHLWRADTVVVHWTFSFRLLSTAALLLAPFSGAHVVCILHTAPEHMSFNRMTRSPPMLRRAAWGIVRSCLTRCEAIVALSPSHAAALASAGLTVTHVAPIPVAPQAAGAMNNDGRPRPEPLTLGFVGELSRIKGADLVPGLVARLVPQYRIRVVGAGELASTLAADMRALPPDRRAFVSLTAPAAPSDVPALLRGMDALVIPSRSESQCRIAVEAMLAGSVVIAAPVQGLADLVEDGSTGFFIDPERPETVEAVLEKLSDPALRGRIRRQALLWAEEYNGEARQRWLALLQCFVVPSSSRGAGPRRPGPSVR